ncbi:ArsR/SmtB family transcription factor [Carboxydothermus ferrireducens]|uniref:ArsR family transcriptional regulator n=1 Tax=Carboxydothermus ferrireducens DSM 11255 TaxID=1119529 RepID=A0ABX2RB30_9THEO|nr:metalloregulator ArsR/SmtB family transcription factor [Carboxydothermus ferrireducens]NYE56993.1 ArsR family transcriptional regulator [Carboxydothermus ferrireducens DSM 11255]
MNLKLANYFKALGHPLRIRIIKEIAKQGELCVCELLPILQEEQSLVSKHLGVLRTAGVLNFRREGTRKIYSLAIPELIEFIKFLEENFNLKLKQKKSGGELK